MCGYVGCGTGHGSVDDERSGARAPGERCRGGACALTCVRQTTLWLLAGAMERVCSAHAKNQDLTCVSGCRHVSVGYVRVARGRRRCNLDPHASVRSVPCTPFVTAIAL